jgi:hypothetical protein
LVYDDSNGYVYVPNYGSNNVSVIGVTSPTAYSVTFSETGLPVGYSWSVTLNGTTETSNATRTVSAITFTEPNGTYSFTVGSGNCGPIFCFLYDPTPSHGSLVLNGAAETIAIPYGVPYPISFTESGLPGGTSWAVTLNGTTESSATPAITFNEPNGTYGYTVGSVSGYASSPSSGSVTVAGSSQTVVVTFTAFAPGTFAVTFTESGLPQGALWYANLTGEPSMSSTGTTIAMSLQNGTYSYTLASSNPSWVAVLATGSVTVAGASVSVDTAFAYASEVTFQQAGIPNGTVWTIQVTLTSGPPVTAASGLAGMSWFANSTGPTAHLNLVNGTYTSVITASGYQTTTTGPFTVNGQSKTLPPVAVSPSPSSSGLSWWVWVVVGVVIVVIVVAVVVVVMQRKPPATPPGPPPAT